MSSSGGGLFGASRDSQESGALLNFVGNRLPTIPRIDPNTTDCFTEPGKIMPAHADDGLESEPVKCDQPLRPFAITSLKRRDKLVANER